MDRFSEIFKKIRDGVLSEDEARKQFSLEYITTAKQYILDYQRQVRTGIPEIIYGEHKTRDQIKELAGELLKKNEMVLISRYPRPEEILEDFEGRVSAEHCRRLIVLGDLPEADGSVMLISGGSADEPVLEEAALTLKSQGVNPMIYRDRGIAHPTRVLDALKEGLTSGALGIAVIAGMEAALPVFIASLTDLPIVGIPTSVGYGYRHEDSALTSMLSSCTPGLAVVNVDGGLRGGVFLSQLVRQINKQK